MITKLSIKYQKEIALSLLSIFFVSGFASAKVMLTNASLYTTKYSYNSVKADKGKRITSDQSTDKINFSLKSSIDTSIQKKKIFSKINLQTKNISGEESSSLDKLDIGGPGQPEMSTFKSVGTDNMVDPFSGNFSYNIPLLDVGGYPVNMFYNSGVTMDEESSWLGLGWNINPGTISRNMRGIPDDFDGTDSIKKIQSQRPDKTWGVSGGFGFKLGGTPLSLDLSTGISHNNKLGFATDLGINPSLKISAGSKDDKTSGLSLSAGLGVNLSSRNGANITPSIGLGYANKTAQSGQLSGSLGTSFSYNSRMGITSMHVNAGVSKAKTQTEKNTVGSRNGTFSLLSSNISFAYPTIVPNIRTILTRRNYNLSVTFAGTELFSAFGNLTIGGYYSESKIAEEDKVKKAPAYGMLHEQKANLDNNAMLDFNRLNDGVYTPASPAIAMPVYTYDIFSISGEGTGGSFRVYRGDVGHTRDAFVKTKDEAYSLGMEFGTGNILQGGIPISSVFTPTSAGDWRTGNTALTPFSFRDNNGQYQAAYFKNPGEKTIPDINFQNNIGGENLVRLKLSGPNSPYPLLLPNLIKYDETKNSIAEIPLNKNSLIKNTRDKRTQVISYLTGEEAERVGFDKKIYSYPNDGIDSNKIIFGICNKDELDSIDRVTSNKGFYSLDENYRKPNHISEMDVLGSDGRKYIYGIPVYNTKQLDVSFSIDNGNNVTGKSYYYPGIDDSVNNEKGRDWFVEQQITPAYTHSYLLTALVSPNYVDISGDGITEDDMGDAIKFNYSKSKLKYKWRTPSDSASYSEGLKTDNHDDKAHYVYGERENWFLYSIESKNMIARFYVGSDSSRMSVVGQQGGLDNNNGMKSLKKIRLYSKGELLKHPNNPKPIKTIIFFQSYKLCKNSPNSIASGKGKLTLDSVWLCYNGNEKKPKSKYVFHYPNNNNPGYEYNANDRWGNYKPSTENPQGLTNADYPYSVQQKEMADKYAAAWIMDSISLPSGGAIKMDYESDDYAYVQNKRAASMYTIIGLGNTNSPDLEDTTSLKEIYTNRSSDNDYVYIKLPHPITSGTYEAQKKELTEKYFENTKQLFLKLAVVMPDEPYIPGVEIIPVYADIDDYGLVQDYGDTVAYVKIKRLDIKNNPTPLIQQALQFIRQQLPGKAYKAYDVNEKVGVTAIVVSLAKMVGSVTELFKNGDKALKDKLRCKWFIPGQSFVRLTNPERFKYGGGLRVKRVIIHDNWNKMTGQYASTYGQEYKYTTTELFNGKPKVISSGVAAWEPSVGADENPHKTIMPFRNRTKGGPYDFGAIDMPLGEAFYPSPSIGYSRVEILSIHRDTVKNLPTRQVTEFYTNKDFPFKSDYTILSEGDNSNVKYEPKKILELLKINSDKAVTQSQGFLVDMNDMNGKVKTQATYSAIDSVISFTQNFYNVNTQNGKSYKFNHSFNVIDSANGQINNGIIGRDIELMADFREHLSETNTFNLNLTLDYFMIGVVPIPLMNFLRPFISEKTTYRSASILKVVNHYSMIDSIVNIDKGSMVSTKNLVYDAETGNPLLTRTNNEHDKPIYNFTYPAHWAYSGMGGAYKNIDATYKNLLFRHGILETPIDNSVFESGDELYVYSENPKGPESSIVCDGGNGTCPTALTKNNANRIWAVATTNNTNKSQFVFMDATGNPYTAKEVTMRIIRSGHRNFIDQSVGAITMMGNPIATGNHLVLNNDTTVIQTTAAIFKDHWRVDDVSYKADSFLTTKDTAVFFSDTAHAVMTVAENDSLYYNSMDDTARIEISENSYATHSSKMLDDNGSFLTRKTWLRFDKLNEFLNLHLDTSCFANLQPTFFATAHDKSFSTTCENNSLHPGVHDSSGINGGWTSFNVFAPYKGSTAYGNTSIVQLMRSGWPNKNNVAAWRDIFHEMDSYSDNYVLSNPLLQGYKWTSTGDSILVKPLVQELMQKRNSGDTSTSPAFAFQMYSNSAVIGQQNIKCWNTFNDPCVYHKPTLEFYYFSCPGKIDSVYIDSNKNIIGNCTHKIGTRCYSKFSNNPINPYVEGILGNWRVDSIYVYYGDRKETDPAKPIDTRVGGTIKNFKTFWNLNTPYLNRNYDANDVWVWNSTTTQYNRKGYEIENKDPLGRYNSGLYGYNQQLPIAVINNSRVREAMFDGFEDYDYSSSSCQNCKSSRHANFDSIQYHLDDTQKHTGNYSLKVNAGQSVALNASINPALEPEYGLNVFIDSTNIPTNNDTIITPHGSGYFGKFYNLQYSKICDVLGCNDKYSLDIAKQTIKGIIPSKGEPVEVENDVVNVEYTKSNLPSKGIPDGIYKTDFATQWDAYLQPVKSGEYSFQTESDDGIVFFIDDMVHPLINDWSTHPPRIATAKIILAVGHIYHLRVYYMQHIGGASAKLKWKTPCSPKFTIGNPFVSTYTPIDPQYLYMPDHISDTTGTFKVNSYAVCKKFDTATVTGNSLTDTFSLINERKMLISAWVKEGGDSTCKCTSYANNNIAISFNDQNGSTTLGGATLKPSGSIIEGWQRYEAVFTIPKENIGDSHFKSIKISFNNTGESQPVYFDDIRILPYNANMKSFVYNNSNLRLMAELDENNYASFYEYDDDGSLTRVKKETVRGVKTITETRSAMQKIQ